MSRRFLTFPDFKKKAVTLSYDDGVRQDKRLIAIMQKHGLKGTFNINGGLFGSEYKGEEKGRMTKEEILALYLPAGQEVAIHGYKHWSLAEVEPCMAACDIVEDRKTLEAMFGKVIKGMAYANGSYNDTAVQILKDCGVSYARTTVSTEKFAIPEDWLRMPATCHHNNPRLMELAKAFVETPFTPSFWWGHARLFYLWGHSYEFDNNDNWQVIEEFAEYIGGREDIWYATNGEIYDYVQAYDRLQFSSDGSFVHNPSAIPVYIDYITGKYIIPAGQTVDLRTK